ncbi:MAG: F0F1 ATP synthase subunit gamma [Streptococcaceae bacterium]|jgi:F-type H+-transporting ATPase subunit gamma|nr:F0F1 ATP synthase subunit gamma [Streptococcaceae bacterium]
MAGSLNEIKTKIASTQKTSQITGAMQMVSAAKLQKSEKVAKKYQIYAEKIKQVTVDLVSHDRGTSSSPFLAVRPVKRTGYLVITSDRGLVGGYNSSILKSVMAKLRKHKEKKEEFAVLALGTMGIEFFQTRGIELAYELRGIAEDLSFSQVRDIVVEAVRLFSDEAFDELYVCYNHHINSLSSSVQMEKMLPITLDKSDEAEINQHSFEFELEPNREEILAGLLPQYAESMIYGAIVDAKTAEHAAGMTAMRTATDNAHTVINDLTIAYNRARQASITQEITEIVAGAAAI